jgi:hypothetical protein
MTRTDISLPPLSKKYRGYNTTPLKLEWASWLHGLAPWTHAATFTCKRLSISKQPINDYILIGVAKHLIRRINYQCFRKAANKGESIAVVVTFGWGVYENHPHLHFCFEKPAHLSYEDFSLLIEKAVDKTKWIHRQQCIKPYIDDGWTSYLLKHGTDNLIVPLIQSSASYIA